MKNKGFMAVVALAALASVGTNLVLLHHLAHKEKAKRAEERAQEAMDEDAREETRRSQAMERGIDNLMSYQPKIGLNNVKGAGDLG